MKCLDAMLFKLRINHYDVLFVMQVNHNIGRWSSSSQEFQLNASTSDVPSSYLMGKSPFPVLDHFIESIATIGNVSGGSMLF